MLKYILYEKLSDMHKYMHTYIQTREQIIHHTCMSAGEQTENIPCMSITLATYHLKRPLLNTTCMAQRKELHLKNKWLMSPTRDTSHAPISPCRLVEQSPCGDTSRHAPTARLSSALDCGENTGGWVGNAV